ncbi:MAG: hypothetical protein KBG00_07960 [Rhodoferax sp.]|nr:hypothetical protein [Rhodoferax sp.]MBP9736263.1 hypothetical protein [Rhodoferax sp.]
MTRPRITNHMPAFIADVQRKAARGMAQSLILGASEAAAMTPIGDTSNLINSRYKSIEANAGRIVGTSGYTAAYAQPVHDPEHKQTFRRAAAEKEFLKKGFERAEPNIRAVLTGAIKT